MSAQTNVCRHELSDLMTRTGPNRDEQRRQHRESLDRAKPDLAHRARPGRARVGPRVGPYLAHRRTAIAATAIRIDRDGRATAARMPRPGLLTPAGGRPRV